MTVGPRRITRGSVGDEAIVWKQAKNLPSISARQTPASLLYVIHISLSAHTPPREYVSLLGVSSRPIKHYFNLSVFPPSYPKEGLSLAFSLYDG